MEDAEDDARCRKENGGTFSEKAKSCFNRELDTLLKVV